MQQYACDHVKVCLRLRGPKVTANINCLLPAQRKDTSLKNVGTIEFIEGIKLSSWTMCRCILLRIKHPCRGWMKLTMEADKEFGDAKSSEFPFCPHEENKTPCCYHWGCWCSILWHAHSIPSHTPAVRLSVWSMIAVLSTRQGVNSPLHNKTAHEKSRQWSFKMDQT